MSDLSHETELRVDASNAKKGFDEAAKGATKYEKSADKAAKTSKATEKGLRKVAREALTQAVAWQEVTQAIRAGIEEFAKVQAASGRLDRTMSKLNATTEEQRNAQNLALKASREYGVALDESYDAIRRLADSSGSATTAINDYALAVNIAQAEDMDLAQASEYLAKARKGEVEELKNLSGINKTLAEQLGRMEGDAVRGAEAISILTREYEGAAKANWGTADAMKAADQNANAALEGLGAMATALGKVVGVVKTDKEDVTWFDYLAQGMKEMGSQANEAADFVGDLYDAFSKLGTEKTFDILLSGGGINGVLSRGARQAAIDADTNAKLGGHGMPTAPDIVGPVGVPEQPIGSTKKKRKRRRPGGGQTLSTDPESGQAEGWRDEHEARVGSASSMAEALQQMETETADHSVREAIRTHNERQKLAAEEDRLAKEQKKLEAAKREQYAQTGQALLSLGATALEAGEMDQAATIARAAMDVGYLTYKAFEAGGKGDYAGAVLFGLGAAQAAIVAGSSVASAGGAGGGGSSASAGASAQRDPNEAARESARIFSEEFNREQSRDAVTTTRVINFRKIGAITDDEARLIADAVNSENANMIGGA